MLQERRDQEFIDHGQRTEAAPDALRGGNRHQAFAHLAARPEPHTADCARSVNRRWLADRHQPSQCKSRSGAKSLDTLCRLFAMQQ
ncbi:MAG: hypothetical protein ACO26U_03350 [Burkholderiaceae bacterium]